MTESLSQSKALSPQEFALLTARPETRILLICATMCGVGAVQGFREGWNGDVLLLIAGAVLGVIGMLLYARAVIGSERSWTSAASVLMVLAPYLFGCYLIVYRGLWNSRHLFGHFSIGTVFALVAFVYLGYRLVYWTWQLTEIAGAVRTGKLVIADGAAKVA